MAYDGTIPALGNLVSNDIPAIQENFSLLESAQIVDSGTTADGDYIRYENGWQICVYNHTGDIILSGLYAEFNYPVSFNTTPKGGGIIVDINSVDRDSIWSNNLTAVAYTSTAWRVFGSTDGTYNADRSSFFAIGRWK